MTTESSAAESKRADLAPPALPAVASPADGALENPATSPASSVTNRRFFGPAVKLAIFISAILVLALLIGPFGYPFAGSLERTLLAALFVISNCVSVLYYIAQIMRRKQESKEKSAAEQIKSNKITNRIIAFAVFGTLLASILPIIDTIKAGSITAASFLNGTLFVIFMGGIFLSLGCRLNKEGKNERETQAIWFTFKACVVIAGLICILSLLTLIPNFPPLFFLPEIGSLSRYTFLGINVFINVLFAVIALSSYAGKLWDYYYYKTPAPENLEAEKAKPESITARLWEHRLSIFGLMLGAITFTTVAILIRYGFDPYGGGALTTICAAIMAFAALASIFSKIGRSIDETLATPRPKDTFLVHLHQRPARGYALRLIGAMSLFVMLGFALYGLSALAVPGEFLMESWALGSPIFAFSLAGLAVACIANWMMSLLKPTIKNIPSCQAVAGAKQACEILKALESAHEEDEQMLLDALFVHIKHARELLSDRWRASLITYKLPGAPSDTLNTDQINRDYALLNQLSPAEKKKDQNIPRKTLSKDDRIALKNIFECLANAEIDPAYRPALPPQQSLGLTLTCVGLFAASLALMLMAFTGAISLAATSWALPFAVLLALSSWGTASYLLDQTSGGPYAVWGTIFGAVALTFLALTAVAGFNISIVGISLAPHLAMLSGILVMFVIATIASFKAASDHTNKTALHKKGQEKGDNLRWANRTLTAFKIILALGFLMLAFTSLALFFNLQGLGKLDNLASFAFNVIGQSLGAGGYEIGAQWLAIFSITIFASASFIAFELFKNVLKATPSHTEVVKQHENWVALGVLIFKLTFLSVAVIALTSMPSAFLPGAETAMLPVFLVVMVVMPLFSSNTTIPFQDKYPKLRQFSRWLNTWFGLTPLRDEDKKPMPARLLLRELGVMVILSAIALIAATAAGAPVSFAGPVAAIGLVTTMLFRWGNMEWQASHNPRGLAEAYLAPAESLNDNFLAIDAEVVQLSLEPAAAPAMDASATLGAASTPGALSVPAGAGADAAASAVSVLSPPQSASAAPVPGLRVVGNPLPLPQGAAQSSGVAVAAAAGAVPALDNPTAAGSVV